MPWSDDTRCLYCDGKLPLYRKLTQGQFCSKAHQASYWQEQERLAVERLSQTHDALRAYRPPEPIESILGPAVSMPGFDDAPELSMEAEPEPAAAPRDPARDPMAVLLQLSATSRGHAPASDESIPAPVGLLPQDVFPLRCLLPDLVASEPLEYEFVFRPQPPRHGAEIIVPPAIDRWSLPYAPAVPLWKGVAAQVVVSGFKSAAPEWLDTAHVLHPALLLAPRFSPRAAARLAVPSTQHAPAAWNSRVRGEVLPAEAALEPALTPLHRVAPQSDVLEGLIFDQLRIVEALCRLPVVAALGAGYALCRSVRPRRAAFPMDVRMPLLVVAGAGRRAWIPALAGLRRLESGARLAPPAACVSELRPFDAEPQTLTGAALPVTPVVLQPAAAGLRRLDAIAGSAAPVARVSELAPVEAHPQQPTAAALPVTVAALQPGSGRLQRLNAAPRAGMPAPRVPALQPAELAPRHAFATMGAVTPAIFKPHASGLQSLARAVRPAGGRRAPRAISKVHALPAAAGAKPVAHPETSAAPPDFAIRTRATRIYALPYREQMEPAAATPRPRTAGVSMAHAQPNESLVVPKLRLEPLRDKPLADLFRRGNRFFGFAKRMHPGALMTPAVDFWHHAPRDLKLLLFAIPLLIGLAFHPSLPKVALAAPEGASNIPTQFKQVVTAQVASLKQSVLDRAAIALDEDFRHGMDDWTSRGGATTEWSFDATGFVQPGPLALYKPSMSLSDYQMQFLGMVDQGALSWVARAADFRNYYVIKLVLLRPGPMPLIGLTRYAVIDGVAQDRVDTPVSISVRDNMQYRVRLDVHGDDFALTVQGHMIDSWSDPRLKRGGIGFFTNRGEQSRVRWVQLTHQYDVLGRLCAYLAPYKIPTTTGSW